MMQEAEASVLLADDDPLVLATLSKGLAGAGFSVSVAGSGAEALEAAGRGRPDVALLDVRMGDMTGFEVSRRLAASRVPCVFLSGYHEDAMVSEAAEAGGFGYLVKPLEHWQVVPTLRAALVRAAELEHLAEQERRLKEAIETNRTTGTAVGVFMERHRLDARTAFERIRADARSQRRKLTEVAQEVVDSAERLNRPLER